MKTLLFLLLLAISSFLSAVDLDTLFVLNTTDIHGNLFAYDYFKDEATKRGLVKIHTRINQIRKKQKNVILLDGGDMIQGTPLTYLYNHIHTDIPHPFTSVMNLMGYDAMAVGNHEIEQGLKVCNRLRAESSFPWLAANSKLESGYSYFEPYKIIEKSGIRIAILGLTTPGIPKWIDSSYYEGIEWTDMLITSREQMEYLKKNADVVIGLFHAGLEPSEKTTGLPQENAAGLVADQVPGFDVVFGGHTHKISPVDTLTISDPNKPLKMIAGSHGNNLGIVKLVFEKREDKTILVNKTGWVENVKDYPADSEIADIYAEYHLSTLEFIRKEVAVTETELTTANAYFSDNPLIDLINTVQQHCGNAEISFASCFNPQLVIPEGPVKIKDIYTIYPYENFLFTIEMSGKEIKDYLEYSARFFQIQQGEISISQDIAGYNYDIAEGISYSIDLHYPEGSRIKDLKLSSSGEKVDEDQQYLVALNSFRALGGGGHLRAIGMNQPKILYKSGQEIRNMIIEFLLENPDYKFQANNNWKIKEPKEEK